MSEYKWQFRDENGYWIDYGNVSSGNDLDCRVTASSVTIEREFAKNPNSKIQISSLEHNYTLDFTTMKQTNLKTQVTRDVRRVKDPFRCVVNFHRHMSPEITEITPEDGEYTRALQLLKPTSPNFNLHSLFKINNHYLETAFENKRAQLQHQNPTVQYEVKWLFHGTSSSNVTSIADGNIDWRLHGSKTGQLYGRGAYFASQASESRRYGDTVFICNDLVGLTTTGDSNTIKPPKDEYKRPFDTTVNDTANPYIFVKFNSQEYYPVYYALF
ncbi:protein mono-ADP-ribosyltransferase PARP11-like [Hyalella azteca]|uniref:Poly [ADP-ribose] polymerase n=1 Tax=Hyalella azteca TaxID=294128 RepID=A0A8B7NVX2_HYAAZ|nr:protein mono-ADP-ribosyltransferase PARP11-like [Hyalella azteca]